MPQIKASSSERGPCVFFVCFFSLLLTNNDILKMVKADCDGISMYGWLSRNKNLGVWRTRRIWKVERKEMQGAMV